jgi:hypothetical protein
LSACGNAPPERALTGAGLGAGSGALAGALISGLSVGTGALIGAGVGGVAGALTKPEDINLGKPFWKWGSKSGAE